jgi:transposase-like protein
MNLRSPNMKKRIRHGDPQRRSYWEEVVRRWREGGQSVRAFCRAEELRESAFYFWRRKLARGGRRASRRAPDAVDSSQFQSHPATSTSRSSQRVSPRHGAMPSFLPVHVVSPASRPLLRSGARPGAPEADRGVEIILGQGRTVRVQAGFDRQTLAAVLAVLEVRPC